MSVVASVNHLARKEILKFAALNRSVSSSMQRLLHTAARSLTMPASFSAVFDEEGQLKVHTWYGFDATASPESSFLDADLMIAEDLKIISDATKHPTFANDVWVTNGGVRFFAALPIRTSSKALIGMFCVLDSEPRNLTSDQHKILKDFSNMASEAILLRLESSLIKQASQKIQRGKVRFEKRLDRVVSSLPVPFFAVDKKGLVQDWNRSCVDSFGYSAEDVKGTQVIKLLSPMKGNSKVELLIQRVFNRRRISGIKLVMMAKDGNEKEMLCRMFPYFDSEGNVESCVFVNTELTALQCSDVTFNETQEEYREIAADLMRLKTAFLSNMSHEIRTPLTSIIGFADILGEQVDDANREFTQLIEESAQRLMGTLGAVLDLAQLEAHSLEIKLEPTDLVAHSTQILEEFTSLADEKKLTLRIDADDEVKAGVFLDQSAQKRIMHNLLSNAIKFTRKGEVVVDIKSNQETVTLKVEDSGIGIGKEFLPHIFDEFQQESKGISRIFQGSGLGLVITKKLVELMGGSIIVESKKGKGTTFTVTYPRHVTEYLAA
ncbi:MAG: ATP-binding protein [Rhodothermales bacterium]